jgi:hypothetical protein
MKMLPGERSAAKSSRVPVRVIGSEFEERLLAQLPTGRTKLLVFLAKINAV